VTVVVLIRSRPRSRAATAWATDFRFKVLMAVSFGHASWRLLGTGSQPAMSPGRVPAAFRSGRLAWSPTGRRAAPMRTYSKRIYSPKGARACQHRQNSSHRQPSSRSTPAGPARWTPGRGMRCATTRAGTCCRGRARW
jgi:hypothetical protein